MNAVMGNNMRNDYAVLNEQHLERKARISSMMRLDFYRLTHTPLLFIMTVISAIIPAMVLTMTSANEAADAQSFTNVWQVIEMVSGGNAGMGMMDMAMLCNINMVYIFAAIFVSIFVSHDYSSGFIKNIFTVHSKKHDYVISKSIAGFFGGCCMILAYLIGAIIAGMISGLSFDPGAASVFSIGLCILSKMALMGVFVPLYLMVAVFFRQRLWLTIVGAFFLGIMFYPVAMMSAPLNAGMLNLLMSIAGGVMLGTGFEMASGFILRHRDLT